MAATAMTQAKPRRLGCLLSLPLSTTSLHLLYGARYDRWHIACSCRYPSQGRRKGLSYHLTVNRWHSRTLNSVSLNFHLRVFIWRGGGGFLPYLTLLNDAIFAIFKHFQFIHNKLRRPSSHFFLFTQDWQTRGCSTDVAVKLLCEGRRELLDDGNRGGGGTFLFKYSQTVFINHVSIPSSLLIFIIISSTCFFGRSFHFPVSSSGRGEKEIIFF